MADPKDQKEVKAAAEDTANGGVEQSPSNANDADAVVLKEQTASGKQRKALAYGNTADNLTTIKNPGQVASMPTPSGSDDALSMTHDEIKWERDVFRDVLSNVNQTLRFQIQMAVPLMAGCVTVLNIVPPQSHQELLNDLDRWVFIPVVLSMAIAYRGLEFHWYSNTQRTKLSEDIHELYELVKYKHRMVKAAIGLQALGLILLMVFVLLEYK